MRRGKENEVTGNDKKEKVNEKNTKKNERKEH